MALIYAEGNLPRGTVNLKMKNPCYFCQAPTRIIITFSNDYEGDDIVVRAFITWKTLIRRSFLMNMRFLKKVGSVVRPVCASCYLSPLQKFDLVSRERTGKIFRYKSAALSASDIWNWMDMFNIFRCRKDLKDWLIV
jgi:hypothetical protein